MIVYQFIAVCLESTRLQTNALKSTLSDDSGLEYDVVGQLFYAGDFGLSLKEWRVGIVKEKSRRKSGCRAVTCRGMDAKAKTSSTASVRVFS